MTGRPAGPYYFYYGSSNNSNNACSSSGSSYSGDGISGYGGRYSRVPTTTTTSTARSRLTGSYSSRATGSSWPSSASRFANYSAYGNVSNEENRPSSVVAAEDAAAAAAPSCSSSPPAVASPVSPAERSGAKSSVFLTRSDSVSSSGSARSTGTMCDEGEDLAGSSSPRERQLRSTEPPSRVVTPLDAIKSTARKASATPDSIISRSVVDEEDSRPSVRGKEAKETRDWSNLYDTSVQDHLTAVSDVVSELRPAPPSRRERNEMSPSSSAGAQSTGMPQTRPQGEGTTAADTEEDAQSVSTVSGSGIDFFRKFVQRKGSGCKECEDQFRREVLIDRLVADSLHSKAVMAAGSTARSSRSTAASGHFRTQQHGSFGERDLLCLSE